MEAKNLSNEIHLAKKAAKESGDLLKNNKSKYHSSNRTKHIFKLHYIS